MGIQQILVLHSFILSRTQKQPPPTMSTKEDPEVPVAAAAVPIAETEEQVFSIPGGRWRKGLCDCFSACCCPCMMGWCFPPLLLGQLIERLGYNIFGCPTQGKPPP